MDNESLINIPSNNKDVEGVENNNNIPAKIKPTQVEINVNDLYEGIDSIINTHRIDRIMINSGKYKLRLSILVNSDIFILYIRLN